MLNVDIWYFLKPYHHSILKDNEVSSFILIQILIKYFNLLEYRVIVYISFTGCLNDFSLYVFHPYGAGRKQRPEDMVFSPLTSEERKDSLSVHVAFVKFHLSRSRRYIFMLRTAASSLIYISVILA